MEQIKSSVSLPFHSFTEKPESSRPVVQETSNVEKLPDVSPATTTSKPENDIILLESDSNGEEEPAGAPESTAANDQSGEGKTEDEDKVILLDSDSGSDERNHGDEGNVSLSDLSSSFQKLNQGGEDSSGLVKVTPFDYEAARKEVGFGEGGSGRAEGEDGKKGKREKKKSGGGRKEAAGERSGDFQLGRRRQAFPATGNRSSTFR